MINEELKQYGYEDTLLSDQLKKAGIDIVHIDNGLVHEGLETNKEYLSKTKAGIENLSRLFDNVTDKSAFTSTVSLLRIFYWLRKFHVTRILAGFFIKYRERMELRLESKKNLTQAFQALQDQYVSVHTGKYTGEGSYFRCSIFLPK